jgi:hypothetical protein
MKIYTFEKIKVTKSKSKNLLIKRAKEFFECHPEYMSVTFIPENRLVHTWIGQK